MQGGLVSICINAQINFQNRINQDNISATKNLTSLYHVENNRDVNLAAQNVVKTNLDDQNEDKSVLDNELINFKITVIDATCSRKNNGTIIVSGPENIDYSANLKGININEFKDFTGFARFENIPAGSYNLCLTVDGEPSYKKCYDLVVSKPEQLEVDGSLDPSGKLVSLTLNGGKTYYINLNGTTYTTKDSKISLPLSRIENQLSVKTAIDCQEAYEETIITTYAAISIYPNPIIKGDITVQLTNGFSGSVRLALFNESEAMVLHELRDFKNGSLSLNIDNLPSGTYSMQINTEAQTYTRRIIKGPLE